MAPIVETSCEKLRGSGAGGIRQFKGIPYARPAVKKLRWRAAEPPELRRLDQQVEQRRDPSHAVACCDPVAAP